MTWYEDEVRALEGRCAGGILKKEANTFYGSSSIRLWDSLEKDMSEFKVSNLGFGGSTLEACVHFFERLLLPCKPSSILLYAGDNDLGDGKSSRQVIGYLEAFISKMDKYLQDVPFAFVSVKPSPSRIYLQKSIMDVNGYAQLRLESRANSLYIDVYSRMLDSEDKPIERFYVEDGLHLSADGYRLWTQVVRLSGHLL
jgi:lysophospholipase L1-like esterase